MVNNKKVKPKKQIARIIRKVWIHKGNNNTLLITIPKGFGIDVGDYVEVVKV